MVAADRARACPARMPRCGIPRALCQRQHVDSHCTGSRGCFHPVLAGRRALCPPEDAFSPPERPFVRADGERAHGARAGHVGGAQARGAAAAVRGRRCRRGAQGEQAAAKMLVLHEQQPDSTAYNVQDAVWLRGDVAEDALEAALTALACRQSSMRTHFVELDGRVLQAVLPVGDPRAAVKLHRRTLPAGPAVEAELARLIAQPFALVGGGVPLRIYLLSGRDARVLLLTAHHAIRCSQALSICTFAGIHPIHALVSKTSLGLHVA